MKIASTNVIPPNVPSAKKNQPNFCMSKEERLQKEEEDRKLRKQKADLERLANDKKNPISAPMKVLAVATGAVITAGAMKVTLNTSLEMISKALKSDAFMKTRTEASKAFNALKDSFSAGFKSFKETASEKYNNSEFIKTQKEKFSKTKPGKFVQDKVSPKFTNLKKAVKTLLSDIKQISKEKMPTHKKIKKIFVDTVAILSGGGVAIKESGALNSSGRHDDEEDF